MRTPSFGTVNDEHDSRGASAVYLITSVNFKSLDRERERESY